MSEASNLTDLIGFTPRPGAIGNITDVVAELSSEFREFRIAMTGVPNISKGAIGEIRSSQATQEAEWRSFQAGLPAAINAAIDARFEKRVIKSSEAKKTWVFNLVALVLSGVTSSVTTAVIILALHIGGK